MTTSKEKPRLDLLAQVVTSPCADSFAGKLTFRVFPSRPHPSLTPCSSLAVVGLLSTGSLLQPIFPLGRCARVESSLPELVYKPSPGDARDFQSASERADRSARRSDPHGRLGFDAVTNASTVSTASRTSPSLRLSRLFSFPP